jgi:hypothetical protein
MAKRFVTDTCHRIADEALQLLGGYGYLADYGIEKIVRDLRVHRILEGTNEIMRVIIARQLVGRPRLIPFHLAALVGMRHNPTMRCIAFTLLAFRPAAGPASAQQRVVVVPAGAEVVVPARGASGPRLVNAPRPRIPSRNLMSLGRAPMLESGGALGGSGLAAPALIALPIAAIAAVAAASVPGSGNSSTTAPARTR